MKDKGCLDLKIGIFNKQFRIKEVYCRKANQKQSLDTFKVLVNKKNSLNIYIFQKEFSKSETKSRINLKLRKQTRHLTCQT